jgi:hypothetical protein
MLPISKADLAALAAKIGGLANTKPPTYDPETGEVLNPGGTYDENLAEAIREYLNSPWYDVEIDDMGGNDVILQKLNQHEWVIACLRWPDGRGHFVVIQEENGVANPDGSLDVEVMDPAFGMNFKDKLTFNNASGWQLNMEGEDAEENARAGAEPPFPVWDSPVIEDIIEVSPSLVDRIPGSMNEGLCQATEMDGYDFVITGNITGNVVVNGPSVTGTTGTVYVVTGASAYELSNGSVIVPPPGVLTPATQLGFSNFTVLEGPALFTFVYPGKSTVTANTAILAPSYLPYATKTQIPPSMYSLATYDIGLYGKVGLPDLVILARAYGSQPGDSNWNPNADILEYGKVGLADLVSFALHYGQSAPQWPLP